MRPNAVIRTPADLGPGETRREVIVPLGRLGRPSIERSQAQSARTPAAGVRAKLSGQMRDPHVVSLHYRLVPLEG